MTGRLGFLGPAGSYSEQAALTHDPSATLLPFESISAVAAAVGSGAAHEGVVPIENSLEGSVTATLDLLLHESKISIRNELVLAIHHCLLAKPGTRAEEIGTIYSHPQALAQCRLFLSDRFPGTPLVASLSTSAAVEQILGSDSALGAIANERAAALYGAQVLAEGVEDSPNNETRFVVLAATDHEPTGSDKTSICFEFGNDSPGILHAVLEVFAERQINLTKIESRPTRRSLGRYIFLVDLECHREVPVMEEALEVVRRQVSRLKVLGSYPMSVSSAIP